MQKLQITILSLSLITVMAGAIVSPALGAIQAFFPQADPLLIKFLISLPALFIILTSAAFSFISSKFSSKTIAAAGALLYVLGGCGAGFVSNIYVLLFFRALVGIGVGLLTPLSTGLLSYYFKKDKQAKLMGYSSAMNNLGGITATVLTGILVAISWRYAFAVYALGIIVLVLIVLYLPDEKIKQSKALLTFKEIRTIFPYMLGIFVVMLVFYTLPSNFALAAVHTNIIPPAFIGAAMALQNLAAFATGLILSRVLSFFKKASKYVAGFVFAGGFLLLNFMHIPAACIAGLLCVGFGMGVLVPVLNAKIPQHIEREKTPSAMSLMSMSLFLGQFLSPVITDIPRLVFKTHGSGHPFTAGAVLGFVFVAGMFVRDRIKSK